MREASCIECQKKVGNEVFLRHVQNGQILKCEFCDGLVKPSISFKGEIGFTNNFNEIWSKIESQKNYKPPQSVFMPSEFNAMLNFTKGL